jgi:hypothetical protein
MTKRSLSFSDPNVDLDNLIRMEDDLFEQHSTSDDEWYMGCPEHTIDFADNFHQLSPSPSFDEETISLTPTRSYAMFLEERLQCSKSFSNSSLPTLDMMHYEF